MKTTKTQIIKALTLTSSLIIFGACSDSAAFKGNSSKTSRSSDEAPSAQPSVQGSSDQVAVDESNPSQIEAQASELGKDSTSEQDVGASGPLNTFAPEQDVEATDSSELDKLADEAAPIETGAAKAYLTCQTSATGGWGQSGTESIGKAVCDSYPKGAEYVICRKVAGSISMCEEYKSDMEFTMTEAEPLEQLRSSGKLQNINKANHGQCLDIIASYNKLPSTDKNGVKLGCLRITGT